MTVSKKMRGFLWGALSFFICFTVYLLLAYFLLGGSPATVGSTVSDVPTFDTTEEFSLLLASDELRQYCGVTVYPKEKRITAVLFCDRMDAEGYEKEYSRRVEYTKKTEIDLIGRLGGIVINKKIGYNDINNTPTEENIPQRLFGSRVLYLAEDQNKRVEIAYEILYSLLGTNLGSDDYNYIFASCSTNISYVDFCRIFPMLKEMRENITVTIG